MSFFESDIVQEEAKQLFNDYQELMKLGSDYGKFDREGKKMFIKRMEKLIKIRARRALNLAVFEAWLGVAGVWLGP